MPKVMVDGDSERGFIVEIHDGLNAITYAPGECAHILSAIVDAILDHTEKFGRDVLPPGWLPPEKQDTQAGNEPTKGSFGAPLSTGGPDDDGDGKPLPDPAFQSGFITLDATADQIQAEHDSTLAPKDPPPLSVADLKAAEEARVADVLGQGDADANDPPLTKKEQKAAVKPAAADGA